MRTTIPIALGLSGVGVWSLRGIGLGSMRQTSGVVAVDGAGVNTFPTPSSTGFPSAVRRLSVCSNEA